MSILLSIFDPAYILLLDEVVSVPEIHDPDCFICLDPEFSLMGLPLCKPCLVCGDHVAADCNTCNSGHFNP